MSISQCEASGGLFEPKCYAAAEKQFNNYGVDLRLTLFLAYAYSVTASAKTVVSPY